MARQGTRAHEIEDGTASNFWTDERVNLLKQLIKGPERLSFAKIGARLGCTRNAATSKAHRLGLIEGRVKAKPQRTRPAATGQLWPPRFEEGPRHGSDVDTPPDARIRLADLDRHHCRWPVGDPIADADFGFCGRKKTAGPYCEFHHARSLPVGGSPPMRPPPKAAFQGSVSKPAESEAESDLVSIFEPVT